MRLLTHFQSLDEFKLFFQQCISVQNTNTDGETSHKVVTAMVEKSSNRFMFSVACNMDEWSEFEMSAFQLPAFPWLIYWKNSSSINNGWRRSTEGLRVEWVVHRREQWGLFQNMYRTSSLCHLSWSLLCTILWLVCVCMWKGERMRVYAHKCACCHAFYEANFLCWGSFYMWLYDPCSLN